MAGQVFLHKLAPHGHYIAFHHLPQLLRCFAAFPVVFLDVADQQVVLDVQRLVCFQTLAEICYAFDEVECEFGVGDYEG